MPARYCECHVNGVHVAVFQEEGDTLLCHRILVDSLPHFHPK
jgi:hypothetical protein